MGISPAPRCRALVRRLGLMIVVPVVSEVGGAGWMRSTDIGHKVAPSGWALLDVLGTAGALKLLFVLSAGFGSLGRASPKIVSASRPSARSRCRPGPPAWATVLFDDFRSDRVPGVLAVPPAAWLPATAMLAKNPKICLKHPHARRKAGGKEAGVGCSTRASTPRLLDD